MVISLVNAKGGVGKTTIAVHLAVWLCEEGVKVGFIDADAQELSSGWIEAVIAKQGLKLTAEKATDQSSLLGLVSKLSQTHEVVVIDGPAGNTDFTRTILARTDVAIIPCGPSALDLKGTQQEIDVVMQARQLTRSEIPKAWFVPNKLQPDQRLTRELLASAESIAIPFTKNSLRFRGPYGDAPGQDTVVWHMDHKARHAAEEIRKLFTELFVPNERIEANEEDPVSNQSRVENA